MWCDDVNKQKKDEVSMEIPIFPLLTDFLAHFPPSSHLLQSRMPQSSETRNTENTFFPTQHRMSVQV